MESLDPGESRTVGLRARVFHDTDCGKILMHFTSAFNAVGRTAVLAEVATCVPVLAVKYTAKYHLGRSFRWARGRTGRPLPSEGTGDIVRMVATAAEMVPCCCRGEWVISLCL